MNRRDFLKSGIILLGAPAIVKAENIMRIATNKEVLAVNNPAMTYEEFRHQCLVAVARSMGLPYSMLDDDYRRSGVMWVRAPVFIDPRRDRVK